MDTEEIQENPDIPLRVTISDVSTMTDNSSSNSTIVNLKVTISNTSPDKTVAFLRWSTALEPNAVAMGIFVFTSTIDGQEAECLNLKLRRMLPPSGVFFAQDTIRIEAGGKIESNVEVKAPEVILSSGVRYSVRAKGSWMHVKLGIGSDKDLTTDEDGVLRGDFRSEAVEVDV
ncbi:hypothetical protein BJ878DRAFT_539189 [Calycina marina]|uniref:Uncharacterized protein n=1 Tax=Calycina marina TaxID=1763456 RepID=A0A9P7Z9W8_9HELO|nr:hypothetical protein BJ878DRAFT_539189 [Calycina marina]